MNGNNIGIGGGSDCVPQPQLGSPWKDDDGNVPFGNDVSRAISTNKAPRRIFLGDIPVFLQEQTIISSRGGQNCGGENASVPNDNLVRLMGTVIEIKSSTPDASEPASVPVGGGSEMNLKRKRDDGDEPASQTINTNKDYDMNNTATTEARDDQFIYKIIKFVIDDGTGTINVITRRKACKNGKDDSVICRPAPAPAPATNQKQRKQSPYNMQMRQQKQIEQETTNPPKLISIHDILSAPPPPISLGETVDCIGQIHVDKNDENKIWLHSPFVSIVRDPQASILRQLEISSSPGIDLQTALLRANQQILPNNTTSFYTDLSGSHNANRDRDLPRNRIIGAGNLAQKLCPLHYRTQQPSPFHPASQPPREEAVLNTNDAYRFIRYSNGGINARDLDLLVGAARPNEKRAVRAAVEELQKQGMVYMKEGKYFPL